MFKKYRLVLLIILALAITLPVAVLAGKYATVVNLKTGIMRIVIPGKPGQFRPGEVLLGQGIGYVYNPSAPLDIRAENYVGSDIGAKINAAYATCPSTGCKIIINKGNYSFSTQISLQTNNKPAIIQGSGSLITKLVYTGQATSTILNFGMSGNSGAGIRDLTLSGTSTTDIASGVQIGGNYGFAYGLLENIEITKFGKGISLESNTYAVTFNKILADYNKRSFVTEWSTNAGELINITNSVFAVGTYPTGGAYQHCVDLVHSTSQGGASISLVLTSFDNCQLFIGGSSQVHLSSNHFEMLGNGVAYTPIIINSDSLLNVVSVENTHFINGNDASHSPSEFIQNNGTLNIANSEVSSYGGYVVPYLVTNNVDLSRSYNNIKNISAAGYSKIENDTYGSANVYSLNNGFMSLGTTTVSDANSSFELFGKTSNGTAHFQGFIGDSTKKGISLGYNATKGWATLEPVQLGIGTLDLFLGGYNSDPSGLFIKGSNGKVGIGTTSPTAMLQVTTSSANATTTVEFGKSGQNKGVCHVEYIGSTGNPVYWWWAPGPVIASSTTGCGF